MPVVLLAAGALACGFTGKDAARTRSGGPASADTVAPGVRPGSRASADAGSAPRPGSGAPDRAALGSEFVGRVVEETPDGWKSESGMLISFPDSEDYALESWRFGERLLLVFESLDHRDAEGHAAFRVLETMPAPPTVKGEVIAWPGSCEVGGKQVPDVFAVARYADAEMLGPVRQAWRLSRTAPHFQPIPTAGIACINEGWGA